MMRFSTFVDLVEVRGDGHGDRRAFSFLPDGEAQAQALTFGELRQRARAVGADLLARGARGERILLVFPTGIEFIVAFLGCLYAGAVAVPLAARRNGLAGRVDTTVADARPRWALTTGALLPALRRRLEPSTGASLELLDLGALENGGDGEWDAAASPRPDDLALLQYTSGSTASPKGVMLTHANLLHNQRMIQERYGQSERCSVVTWLPMFHDMGLIGTVLQPLYVGYPSALMPPEAFLQKPRRWLAAISRLGATTSGGPNFAYDLCVDRIPPAERDDLDLSRWEVAFVGSEPVRADTLDRFERAFGPCGFRRAAFFPCYGLAEATLFAAGGRPSEPPVVRPLPADARAGDAARRSEGGGPAPRVVGCGAPAPGTTLQIVDPATRRPLPDGRTGEIWLAGPAIARGYWGQPEATGEAFGARLAGTGEGPFLRSGDLGVMVDGELFVTGRLKEVMIVRGRKHHPHDVERTAEAAHPALRAGSSAAFLAGDGPQERLVLAMEVRRDRLRNLPAPEVARAVRAAVVRGHGLHAAGLVFLRTGSIPKTSSGKIRRTACREAFLAGTLAAVAEDHHRQGSRRPVGPSRPAVVPVPASAPALEERP